MKKIILPLLLVSILVIAGCGTTGSTVTDTSSEDTALNKAEEFVGLRDNEIYEKVKTGMTKQQVLDLAGREPTKIQKMESDIGNIEGIAELEELTGQKMKTKTEYECWYYGVLTQICFMDGKVATKANY